MLRNARRLESVDREKIPVLLLIAYQALARTKCAEILSAVEYFDSEARRAVLAYEPGLVDPLESDDDAPFRVLIETAGSRADHDREKLEDFLNAAHEGGLVVDGVVADTELKARQLWRLREGISDAMTNAGYVYKYDVSVPLDKMDDLVQETRHRLGITGPNIAESSSTHRVRVAGYGHCGDGNLHLNACCFDGKDDAVHNLLEPWIFDRVTELRGSISAEHGLGRCKNTYLPRVKSQPVLEYMRRIKHLFDPQGILNPYKVLPGPDQEDKEESMEDAPRAAERDSRPT